MLPTIVQHSSNTAVVAGIDSLALVCLATGYPIPSISWLKDNVPLNTTTSMNGRINAIEFSTQPISRNNSNLAGRSFLGNETIQEFLNQYTDISVDDSTELGENEDASLIKFFNVS